jgi:hypothetical protein
MAVALWLGIESIGDSKKTLGTNMRNLLSRIYLALLILLSILQLRFAHASELEIQTFRQHVQNFQISDQEYRVAPSGSLQERLADQHRKEFAQAAKNIIRSPYAFTEMLAPQNERILIEFNQQYQIASAGSIRESIFDVARRAASEGLKVNAVLEIQSVWDYKQALQLTLTANQKYQNASSGSLLESVFDLVRRQGFVISKQKLQEFSQMQLQDFRQAEMLFVSLDSQYQSASSRSLIENYFQEGRVLLQGRTIELMRLNAPYMNLQQLMMIRDEYHAKYQSARSGNLAEKMFLAIRNEAQMRLQSAPIPTPVQQTPVIGGPTCEIHSGKNASGQALFRVLDQAGRVIATVLSVQEAVQISMNDQRCR